MKDVKGKPDLVEVEEDTEVMCWAEHSHTHVIPAGTITERRFFE